MIRLEGVRFRYRRHREEALKGISLSFEPGEIEEHVVKALRSLSIERLARRFSPSLSGVEKQRLAIAATLALRPKFLALDKATTDLDPPSRAALRALLKRLAAKRGMGSLIVEDDPEDLVFCDRIIFLRAGEVVADGSSEILSFDELLERAGLSLPPPREAKAAADGRRGGWDSCRSCAVPRGGEPPAATCRRDGDRGRPLLFLLRVDPCATGSLLFDQTWRAGRDFR